MIANDDPLARWSSSDTTLDKPTVTVDADGNGLKARTGLNPPRPRPSPWASSSPAHSTLTWAAMW